MRSILISTAVTAALSTALVAATLATPAMAAEPRHQDDGHSDDRRSSFDLQSHRGGRGEWTEESTAAFAHSLELGVSTLELDTHLTRDNQVVVWHDDVMTASKCADTAPAFAGDPAFPYANDRVRNLTLAQIRTMDCGFQQLPGFPNQTAIAGNRIALLQDVFALVNEYDAEKVRLNVETKVEVAGPDGADEMAALTRAVVGEIEGSGLARRTTVQSFDWASLNLTKEIAPDLVLVALSSGDDWLGVGAPGMSPNLGGIDIDSFHGSLAQAAAAQGYDVISPNFASTTPTMIAEAHSLGLPVIPWTVNETVDVTTLMDEGVDGIITDYPTRVRQIMADRGLALPRPYTR
ncbi:glycerophosphodiester phosphodiesterase [Cryobacterium algoritolerans]|uniref:Glycerophosphodiester phosphodiesterase n=1 Tax=Cryobacterium algoritolerans TaxID=1259184 RepID=A0A4R8WI00_9MICO|nr:glycerophosphodiester phosphodiesterase family protein [Cryobacterium algoritolerans]TFC09677.1 glycerophosphodiester phosphodiesterase [Cryobacterium algoritolerans]